MKKLFIFVCTILLLIPSHLLSKDENLLGAHCIQEFSYNNKTNSDYDGLWDNISKNCNSSGIAQLEKMMNVSLSIKNNKVYFDGSIGKITDDKIKINLPYYGEIEGKINKTDVKLKFTKKNIKKISWKYPKNIFKNENEYIKVLKNCSFDFSKSPQKEVNVSSKSVIQSKKLCFCIDDKKNVYTISRYNNFPNYCQDNSYWNATEISYGLFLKNGGKDINKDNKYIPSQIRISYLKKNKQIKKWIKSSKEINAVDRIIDILDIDEKTAKLLISKNYISADTFLSRNFVDLSNHNIMSKFVNLKKIDGISEELSKEIINKAKNYFNIQNIDLQNKIKKLENELGRSVNYYEKMCTMNDRYWKIANTKPGKTCEQSLIEVEQEIARANTVRQEPTEEQIAEMKERISSSNPTWEVTPTGIGYWNYGNGFGWAPPNPIHDKIIMKMSISSHAKRMLLTGSQGRTIFFAPIK